jgi:hypothetical protein
MPHIFTDAEYADMLYVNGFCGVNDTAAVVEYRRLFPMRRIPARTVFSEVFNTLRERGTLPSVHVSSEPARQHVEEQENILEVVERSPTTNTRTLSTRLVVSRTRVLANIA